MGTNHAPNRKAYFDRAMEICEKWGIPYLDLYHNEEVVNTLHPYTTGPSGVKHYQKTYLYDFVHPSTEGFDVLYPYINDFLIEQVDPYYNDPEPEEKPVKAPCRLWTILPYGLLAVAAVLLRKMRHPLGWALVSGVYGLAFGALCAPVDVAMGGWGYAAAKWASGIPFDIAHCLGNFGIALILFKPLRELLYKLWHKTGK